jgi:putative endonuclease
MGESIMSYFVYILSCADGTLYTGITNDVGSRIADHNEGKGSKYVRSRKPASLVFTEACESKPAALRREIEIKKMTREKKLKLIAGHAESI